MVSAGPALIDDGTLRTQGAPGAAAGPGEHLCLRADLGASVAGAESPRGRRAWWAPEAAPGWLIWLWAGIEPAADVIARIDQSPVAG